MRTLISQTRKAVESELYYLALMSALVIPDMAAALSAENGRSKKGELGERYAAWYEKWIRPRLAENRTRENPLSGVSCWKFRCALLHQGRSQAPNDEFRKIMFIEPGHQNYGIHYCLIGDKALLRLC